jgi:hypothetical protein
MAFWYQLGSHAHQDLFFRQHRWIFLCRFLAMVLHLREKEDDCLLLWAPKYTITMCDWRVFPKIWWCLKQNLQIRCITEVELYAVIKLTLKRAECLVAQSLYVWERKHNGWFYVSFIPLVERHCSIAPEFLKVLSLPKKQELCEFDCYVWDLRQLHDRHLKVKQKLPNELVFGYSHKVPEPWADF